MVGSKGGKSLITLLCEVRINDFVGVMPITLRRLEPVSFVLRSASASSLM